MVNYFCKKKRHGHERVKLMIKSHGKVTYCHGKVMEKSWKFIIRFLWEPCNRCVYMAHVCFYICCSDCVGVCGNVCFVAVVVKNSVFFSLGVLKYVVCLCRGCDGCCVYCLYCEAWSCRCSCMGSVSVSSCRCCMFVSCVHPVAVLNAAFCMTCSLLMLVEDAIGDHTEEAYSRAHNCFIGSHECLLLFTPSCCSECFYDL